MVPAPDESGFNVIMCKGEWPGAGPQGRAGRATRRGWFILTVVGVVPLAVYAFWIPLAHNAQTSGFAFRPPGFLEMHTGLAFRLMTRVYLAVLVLHHPRVNLAACPHALDRFRLGIRWNRPHG